MTTFNIAAGHNPDGMIACGVTSLLKESTEARKITAQLCANLKAITGVVANDFTCNDGTSAADVLQKVVKSCNAVDATLNINIHLNASVSHNAGGVEVYTYSENSNANVAALNIVNEIAALGFKNRGVKYSKSLYFLRKTKQPALLIECCFADYEDDVALYKTVDIAAAITRALITTYGLQAVSNYVGNTPIYRVQVGAFANRSNAEIILNKLIADGYSARIVES